jgi:hypothetical protein
MVFVGNQDDVVSNRVAQQVYKHIPGTDGETKTYVPVEGVAHGPFSDGTRFASTMSTVHSWFEKFSGDGPLDAQGQEPQVAVPQQEEEKVQ